MDAGLPDGDHILYDIIILAVIIAVILIMIINTGDEVPGNNSTLQSDIIFQYHVVIHAISIIFYTCITVHSQTAYRSVSGFVISSEQLYKTLAGMLPMVV